MNLTQRIEILSRLGIYLSSQEEALQSVKARAAVQNGWFVPEFIDTSIQNIVQAFLQKGILEQFANRYPAITDEPTHKKVGLVMAGNIPLVGFHDLLCVFLAGHTAYIKLSSKDEVLIKHIVEKLLEWEPSLAAHFAFGEMLKGCDAYIATGSNNSGRYFEYYFRNYPSIIRRNRTSAAIVTGQETEAQLAQLADDILLYFGLGCRNVSKLYVPRDYDFVPLLRALDKYKWMADHSKMKNNYDYQLAIHILNHSFYMTNGVVLLVENSQLFSPISQVHYEYYDSVDSIAVQQTLKDDLQCVTGGQSLPFGQAQMPAITDFADGVDTMEFLTKL
ncbi:MAG TPA: acyl-CoA reductase [Phnomibacter sp.]|nr:acyl-CoA reductase [Phnomibacter sp.]